MPNEDEYWELRREEMETRDMEDVPVCSECGEYITSGSYVQIDDYEETCFCDDCFEEYQESDIPDMEVTMICECCDDEITRGKFIRVDNKFYCGWCYKKHRI